MYLCGYEYLKLAEKVFPEAQIMLYTNKVHTWRGDIILVGMHKPCDFGFTFPAKIVYVNGEPTRSGVQIHSYYLGPIKNPK